LKAKAVVIPSICPENMPLALLEALHLGKIVIASAVGGLPEMIKDGQNGLLFPAGRADQLAAKIKSLADLDRPAMKAAARSSVANLSLADNVRAIKDIYQAVLNKNN